MGLCCIYRKKGESLRVRDPDKNIHTVRFDGFNGQRLMFTVNGERVQEPIDGSFYIDSNQICMGIIIKYDGCVRIGIDAPKDWDIAREEVPFKN